MSQVECYFVSWLSTDKDLREIWKDMNEQLNIAFRHYNNYQWKEGYPKFFINDEEIPEMYIKNQKRIRDVQMDGYYDYNKKMFIETIYSAANELKEDEVDEDDKNKLCNVEIAIKFKYRHYDKNNKEQYNEPHVKCDFADIMNVGFEPFQNDPNNYMDITDDKVEGKWMKEIKFENVWDRHSCKVYSSIAEETSKGYVGNSYQNFSPIKYFKLNSTDQTFWIEFYSGRNYKMPVKLPVSESFMIEMQMMNHQKLLYI